MDLSLRSKEEVKELATNPTLRLNLRQGSSFMLELGSVLRSETQRNLHLAWKDHEVLSIQWIRRGLPRLYDIRLEYISPARESSIGQGDSERDGRVLEPVKQAILVERTSVTVYKSSKVKGKTAQISFHRDTDNWIVASKHASIPAKSVDDLTEFREARFSLAVLIAQEWFRLIASVTCDCLKPQQSLQHGRTCKSKQQINELKRCLDSRTLIGEYLTDRSELSFYALVDNASPQVCLPPIVALTAIKYFGLSQANFTKLGVFTELNALHEVLRGELLRMERGLEEEGCVLHFVKNVRPDRIVEAAEAFCLQGQPRDFKIADLEDSYPCQETIVLAKLRPLEHSSPKPSTVVLLTLGFPGIGKSHLAEALGKHLRSSDVQYQIISSDDIRAEAMQRFRGEDDEAAFYISGDSARAEVARRLGEALQMQLPKQVIFLDKNITPTNISRVLSLLKAPDTVSLTIAALTPTGAAPLAVNAFRYPFSMWSLVESLSRLKTRRNHATLKGSAVQKAAVCLKLFQTFRECSLEKLADRLSFKLIRLPFTYESTRLVPSSLYGTIASLLGEMPVDSEPPSEEVERIVKELEACPLEFRITAPVAELVDYLDSVFTTDRKHVQPQPVPFQAKAVPQPQAKAVQGPHKPQERVGGSSRSQAKSVQSSSQPQDMVGGLPRSKVKAVESPPKLQEIARDPPRFQAKAAQSPSQPQDVVGGLPRSSAKAVQSPPQPQAMVGGPPRSQVKAAQSPPKPQEIVKEPPRYQVNSGQSPPQPPEMVVDPPRSQAKTVQAPPQSRVVQVLVPPQEMRLPESVVIDVSESLGPHLLFLLKSALKVFKDFSPLNRLIKEDFHSLQQAPNYTPGCRIGPLLSYPPHLQAEIKGASRASELQFTHLLYVPNRLLAVSHTAFGAQLVSPYLTLVTGQMPLQVPAPHEFSEVAQPILKTTWCEGDKQFEVYRLSLSPAWSVVLHAEPARKPF
jgi:hypothetical protein